MRRSTPRRSRRNRTRSLTVAALVAAVALGACRSGARSAELTPPTVLDVATVRCRQPTVFRGYATVVGDNLVVTAAHVVDGELRSLEVGGRPASVISLDAERDLAVVAARLSDGAVAAELADGVPAEATLVTVDDRVSVAIERHIIWRLDTVGGPERAPVTYRRDAVVFAPAVDRGTSGAPLIDASGRLAAVVVATASGETFAVTAAEVATVLDEAELSVAPTVDACG